jgi:hypothetical protein
MVQNYFPTKWKVFALHNGPEALPLIQYYCNSVCIFLYIAFSLHYQTGTAMTQYISYYSFILNNSSSKDEIFYKASAGACPKYFSFVHVVSLVSKLSHNFTWPHFRSVMFFPLPSGVSLVYCLLLDERRARTHTRTRTHTHRVTK